MNIQSLKIEHVYREYNADADSIANETIDNYIWNVHRDGLVINENWNPTRLPPDILESINALS